jgi:hypothetical protein
MHMRFRGICRLASEALEGRGGELPHFNPALSSAVRSAVTRLEMAMER